MTLGLGDNCFYLTPKAKATTTKNKYVELNQTNKKNKKTLLYDKENLQQDKTATYWMGEKFSNNISDKELIIKVYKEFIQLQKKSQNKNPILKMGRRSE